MHRREPIRHALKTWLDPFDAVWRGLKTHEVRKNDREFRVGDCSGCSAKGNNWRRRRTRASLYEHGADPANAARFELMKSIYEARGQKLPVYEEAFEDLSA